MSANGNGHSVTHLDDLDSLARVSGVGFGGSGMSNHVTGMGTSKDPTSYFQVSLNRPKLSQIEQDAYVEQFGLCRKIVSTIPTASTHKWGRVTLSEGNQDQINTITDYLNAVQIQQPYGNDLLGTQNGFQEALAIAFQSGNAAWLMDIDDGGSPEDELDESRIKSIRSITLVDRWFVRPEMLPTIVRIGNNEANGIRGFTHYTLTGMSFGTTTRVHKSRVLWFRGAELKGNSLYRQSGCDDSMLEGLTYCLNMMFNVIGGLGRMSVDYEVTLHKIQGLLQGIEDGGAKAVEKYRERLNINSTRRSLYNDYIVDKELEDIVHVTRQVSGYGEIYDRILKFVQQSSPYPPAVLMGDFASGLDASGKETSERSLWNDTIAQVQMQKLHGNLMRWLNLVCLSKDGPTKGKAPKGLGWQWIPLYQMTPSEQADLELTQSQVITALAQVDPRFGKNALLSHYGSSEYNPNTTLSAEYVDALQEEVKQVDQPDQGQEGVEGATPDQGADQGSEDGFNFEEFQQPGDEAAPEESVPQTDSDDWISVHFDSGEGEWRFDAPDGKPKQKNCTKGLYCVGASGKGSCISRDRAKNGCRTKIEPETQKKLAVVKEEVKKAQGTKPSPKSKAESASKPKTQAKPEPIPETPPPQSKGFGNRTASGHKVFDRSLTQEGKFPTSEDFKEMTLQIKQKLGMTPKEAKESLAAVFAFTGNAEYTQIRKDEREGKKNPRIKAINRYIEKAPKYEGEIYRGLNLKTQDDLDNFLRSTTKGSSVTLDAMSSFSSDRSIAHDFATDGKPAGSILLKVKDNRSGASIRDLTEYPEESEVLVPKGASYKVVGVTKNDKGIYEVELEDTAPPLEKKK